MASNNLSGSALSLIATVIVVFVVVFTAGKAWKKS
jgi:hypothetical protein